jgi:hypothetical protein
MYVSFQQLAMEINLVLSIMETMEMCAYAIRQKLELLALLQPGDYETVEIHGKLVVRFTRDLLDKMISEYKADEDAKTDHEMKPLVLQSRQELRELIVEFTILQLDLDKIRDTDPMFHTLYNEAIHSMAHYAFTQF